MSLTRRWHIFVTANRSRRLEFGLLNGTGIKHQPGLLSNERAQSVCCLQVQREYVATKFLHKERLWPADIKPVVLARKITSSFERISLWSRCGNATLLRQFGHGANEVQLCRDLLVRLWVADSERKNSKYSSRRRQRKTKCMTIYDKLESFQSLSPKWSSFNTSIRENIGDDTVLNQPPTSQSILGFLKPASPEEAMVAPLLARSNLLITRNIEWANLVLGFEQENRYAVVDVCYPRLPVGFISEKSNVLSRQLLRLRRPFVAYITDALGNELFRVRRPFWWITSSIYAEINSKEIGVVHRRWHLWKRIYDLYLGNKQFAVVENPGFWNWTFTLKDINGNVLAQIDRDWRGFGFEIEELEVVRPLTLSERAVTVALAISLDNDYFSRHGGWAIPFVAVGE
ncbi:hypothetical protein K2173_026519 [Erythroxylum novogranatense]|uniref:Phospholipid scramblase n=1 Tax=Erythroxylum novogranatense TaxID=1862640 RepID=A0AAV8TWG6_9ROSI|nr:hypothetical protein K2173_026519 [Erythroxylum novogranatense]